MRFRERYRPTSSLASDATLSVFGAVTSVGISGVASVIIARRLGVTDRGRWGVISSLAVLVGTLASSGLPVAAGYAAGRLASHERLQFVQAVFIAAALLSIGAGLTFLAAALVIQLPAAPVTVGVAAVIPVAMVLFAVCHTLVLTVASVRWFVAAQLSVACTTLVLISLISVGTNLTVLSVILVSATALVVGSMTNLIGLSRHSAIARPLLVRTRRLIVGQLRPYAGYALTTFAILSLTQIVQRVDLLLVNAYRGPHAAGLYAVSVQVTDVVFVLPSALGFVIFRRGTRATQEHWSDALILLRWTFFFAVAATVVIGLLASRIVLLLFGAAYEGSIAPLRLLLLGVVAFSTQSVISNYLASRGRRD